MNLMHRLKHAMGYVFLDWNSGGELHPNCIHAMRQHAIQWNSHAQHKLGQVSNFLVNNAYNQIMKHFNASNYDMMFTCSTTEANVHIMHMFKHIFVSDTEHSSILDAPGVHIVPVDNNGALDLEYLEEQIQDLSEPFLVSMILANNETGIVNDLAPIRTLVKKYGGSLHTDAAQAIRRIEFSLDELDVDYLSIAAYKCGGPVGIGALLYKKGARMEKFYWGSSIRSESLAAPLILGFAATFDIPYVSNKYLEDKISDLENVVIVGKGLNRLPNTTCIYMKNLPKQGDLLMGLDRHNICTSAGCNPTSVPYLEQYSRSVKAMGITYPTVRISSGWSTTTEDFDQCYEAIKEMNGWKR